MVNQARIGEESGVTLVEVMIAAGILAVSFVYLIGGIVDISDSNKVIEGRTQAGSQLASVMEQMRSMSFEAMMNYTPPTLPELGESAQVTLSCVASDGGNVPLPLVDASVASSLPNPLEVRATVTWRDSRGRLNSQQLSSFFRR